MKIEKGLLVQIYEGKEGHNCSNGGISSNWKRVLLIGDDIPKVFDNSDGTPTVKIVKRNIGGEYLHAEPIESPDPNHNGWMAGGSFIYTSDSRFPSRYPISLHDRQEVAQ